MEGKIALKEHFSTDQNNSVWNAKGEEDWNGAAYARDVERRLLDPAACIREMGRAGIELRMLSLTSPGVQSVVDPKASVGWGNADKLCSLGLFEVSGSVVAGSAS